MHLAKINNLAYIADAMSVLHIHQWCDKSDNNTILDLSHLPFIR